MAFLTLTAKCVLPRTKVGLGSFSNLFVEESLLYSHAPCYGAARCYANVKSNEVILDPRFDRRNDKYKFLRTPRHVVEQVPDFRGVDLPVEGQRLRMVEKVPHPIPGQKAVKMPKQIHLIRGEEEVHTDLLHGQYGIVAQRGGHMRFCHFEMIRLSILRKLNAKKGFAIWRIDAPWMSHTKKGIGKRMGGGKGNISFYTTPIKAKRVIMEVAGPITFLEVKRMLDNIANKLPFPARAMTQEMIDEERLEEKRLEKENLNPYTFKYIMQNNMLGSQMWAKKYIDLKYFGKYD